MHRTTGTNNSSNMFTDGPPGTVVEHLWLNDVQETIIDPITTAGISLVAGTYTQLTSAIRALALSALRAAANTFVDTQTFAKPTTGNSVVVTGNAGSPAVAVTAGTSQTGIDIQGPSTAASLVSVHGYIDLATGAQPSTSTGFSDVLTKAHFSKAWISAQFTGNKAAGASLHTTATGVNVTSAVVQSAISTSDSIRLTFAQGFFSTVPPCIDGNLCHIDGFGRAQNLISLGFKYVDSTHIDVYLTDHSGAAIDLSTGWTSTDFWLNLVVFGKM